MYGGTYVTTPSPSGAYGNNRLTPGERAVVARRQKATKNMMATSISAINRNILKFVNEYERFDKKKPEDYDDAILELEAAINRLLELRFEAMKMQDKKQAVQHRLALKAYAAVKQKEGKMRTAASQYLEDMAKTVPFAPKGLTKPFEGAWEKYEVPAAYKQGIYKTTPQIGDTQISERYRSLLKKK